MKRFNYISIYNFRLKYNSIQYIYYYKIPVTGVTARAKCCPGPVLGEHDRCPCAYQSPYRHYIRSFTFINLFILLY